MIDAAQPVLLLVIIVLAFLLLILGIQVFFILRELRRTISKANKILDDTGVITESVSKPISSLSSVVSGIKTGVNFANFFKSKFYKEDESEGKKNKD
ncbi:MAG: hypothetical protein M1268_00035 [Patescibacteria group bacterium]|nr:hypothetical protein [Patescibacteria group bacterium]